MVLDRQNLLMHSPSPRGYQVQMKGYHGVQDSIDHMVKFGLEGQAHPTVRQYSAEVIRQVYPRDYLSELAAVYYDVCRRIRYTRDPLNKEFIHHPVVTLQQKQGDCFAEGTLLLRDDYTFVPVEAIRPGERIWGRDRWSVIEQAGPSGVKPITAIRFSNGSWARLSEDHKVYVLRCLHDREGVTRKCSCPLAGREMVRIHVAQLRQKDVMLTPDRLPYGAEEMDADRAWVEGIYLADGWTEDYRFGISGKDGCPKEEQKRRVEALCAKWGISTRWHEKYISVNNREWAQRLSAMGGRAPAKHMLSLGLAEPAACAYLQGIMADSGLNSCGSGRTLTTTSRLLMLQTRMLLKMAGVRCSTAYIENHGGLGTNPIYRLGVPDVATRVKPEKFLRVKEILREVDVGPTWDVTTDDHFVYLPEADVTVSNCDDMALLIRAAMGASSASIGNMVQYVVVGFVPNVPEASRYTHVFARAQAPDGRWIILDPVAGPNTRQMIGRVVYFRAFDTDGSPTGRT